MAAAGLPFCGINLTPTGYTWPLNGDSRDWADGDWGGWCSSDGRGRPRCVCRRRGAEGQRRRRVGRGQVDDELFAVGKPVSRRRSSTSKYCLGRSACIQCTGSPWQWGLVSEPWPAICCCSTLASKGAFTVECGRAEAKTGQVERAMSINNLAAKATFLLLSLVPRRSQCGNIIRCGVRQQSYFAGKGCPNSWSGISKILAAGNAGRLKSVSRGITIMDLFRS
ncbi:hypothetical protein NA56DRAFT_711955 [Hyaloscypha hepaticicola]|uniref:Uncharacterized protein n=1 Tax=Hyaloscypha hepaticicola TaxID=2082293 RepID=A0A2J6PHR7_9HELO|nr:hypothetical protein NA56DRAFT_711955 [Hyaloscypha hepaticicola]